MALEVAIPLHKAEIERLTVTERLRIARHAGEVLACHGDVLQFRSPPKRTRPKRHPEAGPPPLATRDVFNALARGLAAAATLGQDIDHVLRELRGDG